MQIICTSLQTENHASTTPLSFYRPDVLPATQPTVSKHWDNNEYNKIIQYYNKITQYTITQTEMELNNVTLNF